MVLSMSAICFCIMITSGAEIAANADNTIEATNPQPSNIQHTVAKRAWQQLQSGWGKRNSEDDQQSEPIDDLHRQIMKIYSDQLLSNKIDDDDEYVPEEYDMPSEKRAWKSMSNAWGKRDWSQLRGNGWGKRAQGWNKLSSAWGKRNPGWNKLSSAWGK
ncbi:CLUMA_CG002208, isoform A [Clunio marinus]|uniref:CLUMA_CG002208, isoform A n=1 Tax=Clunio marinus TaxID=568069 RepID=A0A1J1HKE9_9DIPT|nr:CLUMA_CG002208, isoform A [Clunio marinus]